MSTNKQAHDCRGLPLEVGDRVVVLDSGQLRYAEGSTDNAPERGTTVTVERDTRDGDGEVWVIDHLNERQYVLPEAIAKLERPARAAVSSAIKVDARFRNVSGRLLGLFDGGMSTAKEESEVLAGLSLATSRTMRARALLRQYASPAPEVALALEELDDALDLLLGDPDTRDQ